MQTTPQTFIARAHSDRNHKLAQAWSEIVSRKATEAGWSPERALESARNVEAFESMTQGQRLRLVFRARTSRPNETTWSEVKALLVGLLPPPLRCLFAEEQPLTEIYRAELEEIERVRRATDGQAVLG